MNRFASHLMLFGGVATSAVALFLVYLIASLGFNLMGLYWLFIVPVGAFLVGMASGVGYAVMSKWTNYRAGGIDLLFVLGVSLATYGASHYVTYRHVLSVNGLTTDQVSFVDYMKLTTETAEMADQHGKDGWTVGKFGYVLLLLEAVGFCGGAAIPLLVVSQNAYCEACGRFMKPHWEAYHSSKATTAELKGKKPEKIAIIEAAMQDVLKRTFGESGQGESESSAAIAVDAAKLESWRAEMSPTAEKKAVAKLHLVVKHCDQCGRQHAAVKLEFVNVDKQAQSKDLLAAYVDAAPPAAEMEPA